MTPEYEAIHDLVRLDPESVWNRLRRFLCSQAPEDERIDLVEDLMFVHADAFVDRLETLVGECPDVGRIVAIAYVGGSAETPGLTRFYALQDRLSHHLDAGPG